jgi:hypothetical protein
MVPDDNARRNTPEDVVAVLTRRGRVVWSHGPRRVTFSKPCTIDPTGVKLHRWPMRSLFISLERVDRFDVVLEQAEIPGLEFERLVLVTSDGKTIPVQAKAIQWLSGLQGVPVRARARELNNHILPTWRAARPSDGEAPPTRI